MKTVSLLQSAAFRMSPVVIPALAAANAAALLVECALNILVSIPALSNRDLSHLARVDEHTGLCGLTTARNNLVCSSLPPVQKGSVFRTYARKVCCGQSLLWVESAVARKSWEEELCSWLSLSGLFCQTCFLKHHPFRSVSAISQV